jgi:hypothetical protein
LSASEKQRKVVQVMEEERKRDLDLGNGNVHKHVVMEESFVVTALVFCKAWLQGWRNRVTKDDSSCSIHFFSCSSSCLALFLLLVLLLHLHPKPHPQLARVGKQQVHQLQMVGLPSVGAKTKWQVTKLLQKTTCSAFSLLSTKAPKLSRIVA